MTNASLTMFSPTSSLKTLKAFAEPGWSNTPNNPMPMAVHPIATHTQNTAPCRSSSGEEVSAVG